MRIFISLLICLIGSSLLTGCVDEEFTTSSEHTLTFSADTVRFDTLLTTISSSTTRLMVYNEHKKAINIESIQLRNADQSGFRVNVDGMKGDYFEQIEISKKDSLYIFVEVTLNPTGMDTPERREDILEFSYNGIRQQVILEAYGQDAILWRGKTITCDTVLSATKPFLIYDSLYIAPDKTLTLEAGTRLCMHDKARIIADGKLIANGLPGNPVILRGDRTDRLFRNLAYDQMPGQWGGIIFKSNSFGNKFAYTEVRGTSFGIQIDSTNTDTEKLRLENCILKNSNKELLKATRARVEGFNCEFSNAGSALVKLQGGNYRFTHCTFANLYPFGIIDDAAVHLANYTRNEVGDVTTHPLEQADFNNCIIWGNRSVEVNLDNYQLAGNDPAPFEHRFDHCLIKAKGEDDSNFINIVWDEDPLFHQVDSEEYLYNFNLSPESPACQKGNPIYAVEFPTDLNGNGRSADAPALGAYQATTVKEDSTTETR